MAVRIERELGGQVLSIESGKLAKQADGAVVVQYGDTVVLVTVVTDKPREGIDFFPLSVDYREKTYAAGKFPGGFIKREGRPTSKEILTARLVDRPVRPLFPEYYKDEVQIMCAVLSADRENDPDILSLIGAGASLMLSHAPFAGPIGSLRVGRINNELILMPTHSQLTECDLSMVVSGNEDRVVMMEGFAKELSEEDMLQAIMFAQQHIRTIVQMQRDLVEQMGRATPTPTPPPADPLVQIIYDRAAQELRQAKCIPGKLERADAVTALKERFVQELTEQPESEYTSEQVLDALHKAEYRVVRDLILEGHRLDGRPADAVRELTCEVGVLPRTHGSAIFSRGETQALVTVTLGTTSDRQRVDGLVDEYAKRFMLDYNFPPFSVGEVRPIRGPGRREIGHGALAERSLSSVMPADENFAYTVRVVSDILECNGSSSMATVCGATLSLMDAGVPISDPVAGISIGLVKEADRWVLLTDIMGDEDHFGDMDFKVAGTQRGITGIQVDLKIDGISEEIIRAALDQAKTARMHILAAMLHTIRFPRPEISSHAPRLIQVRINPDKIGLLIGPGGKTVKRIQEETGADIEIEDDGTVTISCLEATGAEAARKQIELITEDVEVGKIYTGRVSSVKDFGAFVEILPGKDGLVHISELSDSYVQSVSDVCRVGDEMLVKVVAIDDQNRIKLSRKAAMRDGPRDRDGDRDRDRDR